MGVVIHNRSHAYKETLSLFIGLKISLFVSELVNCKLFIEFANWYKFILCKFFLLSLNIFDNLDHLIFHSLFKIFITHS